MSESPDTRLFVSLYLDEDVSALVARLVRARGFDVLATLEADRIGQGDAEQLAFAAEQKRALVTHNRVDFEELAKQYLSQQKRHSGIIMAVRRQPYELARRLLAVLNRFTADEMDDRVLCI